MKVVLDANILVSSILDPDSDERTMVKLLTMKMQCEIFASVPIADEMTTVMLEYAFENNLIQSFNDFYALLKLLSRAFLAMTEVEVPTKERRRWVPDDEEDDKYVDAALAADVDYLISNDKHLLDLQGKINKDDERLLEICSAKEFRVIMARALLPTRRK